MRNFWLGVAATLIVVGGLYVWDKMRDPLPSVLAPPAKELKNEKVTTLACKPITVFRESVKREMGLPAAVVRDAEKKVVAASPVPASDYPHTMTAVYDSGTGGVDMFLRRDPLPWVAASRRAAVGMAYGVRDGVSGPVAQVYGRLELLQVKALHAGLGGNADTGGGVVCRGGIEYRW